jgi:hypothetical protein
VTYLIQALRCTFCVLCFAAHDHPKTLASSSTLFHFNRSSLSSAGKGAAAAAAAVFSCSFLCCYSVSPQASMVTSPATADRQLCTVFRERNVSLPMEMRVAKLVHPCVEHFGWTLRNNGSPCTHRRIAVGRTHRSILLSVRLLTMTHLLSCTS